MDGDIDVRQHPSWFFQDALRMDYSSAIRSKEVGTQDFFVVPRHWFIDAWFCCERCNGEFCWTKEEQKHWFDKLKLRVDSVPHVCPQCRWRIRKLIDLRKRYDAEIATALKKSAPIAVKKEMLDLVDRLQSLSNDNIPESIQRNRRTLKNQLANE